MIEVEFYPSEISGLDYSSVTLYVANKLRNAGIPVTGWPGIKVERGFLNSIYLVREDKMIYQWAESSQDRLEEQV